MKKYRNYTTEQLIKAAKEATSMIKLLELLDLKQGGGTKKNMHRKIKELNIDTSHWTGQGYLKGKTHSYRTKPLEELFVKGKEHSSMFKFRNRLIKDGYWVDECQSCGVTDWMGQKLGLQVHHVNGDRADNTIENLELLCPNCHSITDNYAGKSSRWYTEPVVKKVYNCIDCNKAMPEKRVSGRCVNCYHAIKSTPEYRDRFKSKVTNTLGTVNISNEDLESQVRSMDFNFTEIGKFYGVSRTAIKNWLRKRGMSHLIPNRINQYK